METHISHEDCESCLARASHDASLASCRRHARTSAVDLCDCCKGMSTLITNVLYSTVLYCTIQHPGNESCLRTEESVHLSRDRTMD